MEIFTELNVHGFNPIEVFMEILSHCLGQKCLLLSNIEVLILLLSNIEVLILLYHSWGKFGMNISNHEKCRSLAQQIFACIWYIIIMLYRIRVITVVNSLLLLVTPQATLSVTSSSSRGGA